jgi:hypothetical protein
MRARAQYNASGRPFKVNVTMPFVPVKDAEQQSVLMLHRCIGRAAF